jgi:hypothetical protein
MPLENSGMMRCYRRPEAIAKLNNRAGVYRTTHAGGGVYMAFARWFFR